MGYIEAVVADRSLREGIKIHGMPCSSDGQRGSLAEFVQHTERGRRFESGHGNKRQSQ